jgi:23S rRNA pseudouridine2605 synthase
MTVEKRSPVKSGSKSRKSSVSTDRKSKVKTGRVTDTERKTQRKRGKTTSSSDEKASEKSNRATTFSAKRPAHKTWAGKRNDTSDSRHETKSDNKKNRPFEKFRKPDKPTHRRKYEESDSSEKKTSGGKISSSSSKPSGSFHKSPHPATVSHSRNTSRGIRLNKYIANAGVCSRREADKLIESGVVKINGLIVSELGSRVQPGDVVSCGDQKLVNETPRYVLLNKPKDYLTTTEDPENRKTVMALVKNACRERIYPVGRLDRQTTGLLLFTNDGELTKKLMHPSHRFKKLYHVSLDKNLTNEDLKKISTGLILEDGNAPVDGISYVGDKKDEVGVEIHIGKNRIVRRIFEHLGYKVVKLDRVMLGPLTKKDLPRGRFRMLTEKEVSYLKML